MDLAIPSSTGTTKNDELYDQYYSNRSLKHNYYRNIY